MTSIDGNNITDSEIVDIKNALYLPSIDEYTKNLITKFITKYHSILEEYNNSEDSNNFAKEELRRLTGIINEYTNLFNSGSITPAMHLIDNLELDYATKMQEQMENNTEGKQNSYSRILKLQDKNIQVADDVIEKINGFTIASLILGATAFFGIILGGLLFYIR